MPVQIFIVEERLDAPQYYTANVGTMAFTRFENAWNRYMSESMRKTAEGIPTDLFIYYRWEPPMICQERFGSILYTLKSFKLAQPLSDWMLLTKDDVTALKIEEKLREGSRTVETQDLSAQLSRESEADLYKKLLDAQIRGLK
jgi:hypothetical protein